MNLTPRQLVTQFAHGLQQNLFPVLESAVGPLTEQAITAAGPGHVTDSVGLALVAAGGGHRSARDRAGLATAFMAKAIFNLPTTRDLIARLRVDEALRQFCGWSTAGTLPHGSKFSRACNANGIRN